MTTGTDTDRREQHDEREHTHRAGPARGTHCRAGSAPRPVRQPRPRRHARRGLVPSCRASPTVERPQRHHACLPAQVAIVTKPGHADTSTCRRARARTFEVGGLLTPAQSGVSLPTCCPHKNGQPHAMNGERLVDPPARPSDSRSPTAASTVWDAPFTWCGHRGAVAARSSAPLCQCDDSTCGDVDAIGVISIASG